MLHRSHPQRVIVVTMACVVVLTVALFYLEQQTSVLIGTSRQSVGRTYELERAFQLLTTILGEAESGQRGFLLTADARYLGVYQGAHGRADRAIEHLRALTRENPAHQSRVDRLAILTLQTLVELESTVALERAGRHRDAMEVLDTGNGEVLMNAIRALSSEARTAELALLDDRQQAFDAALAQRRWVRRALMLTSLFLTLSAFYFAARLKRLESFATMCAWSRTIQLDGQWVTFEEYLSRRFNVRVSHGIAPRELDKLISQIDQAEEARDRSGENAGEAA